MKNLRNIILKIIFAGIVLFPVNSVKALSGPIEVRISTNIDGPNAAEYKGLHCGGIALLEAAKREDRQDAIPTIQQATQNSSDGGVIEKIGRSVNLNVHVITLTESGSSRIRGQMPIFNSRTGLMDMDEEATEQAIIREMAQFKNSPQRMIHFVCIFRIAAANEDHGILVTINKDTDTMFFYTEEVTTQYSCQPIITTFTTRLKHLYEIAIPEMAQPQHQRHPHDDEMERAIAASLGTEQPQEDGKFARAMEISRLEEEGRQLEKERQQLEEVLRASIQTAPQPRTQTGTLIEDQWKRLEEVAPGLIGQLLNAKAQQGIDNLSITVADVSDGLLDKGNLNYVLHGHR